MGFLALIRLAYATALRRIRADWRLELAIAVGMLLAVSLMAGGVVYSTAVEEAALQRTLQQAPRRETNVALHTFYQLGSRAPQRARRFVELRVLPRIQSAIRDWSELVQTSTFYFQGHPQLELNDDVRPRGKLQYIKGYEERVRIVEGRLPQDASGPYEVTMDSSGLELLGLKVADEIVLKPAISVPNQETIKVRIVGSIERIDPDDDFWFNSSELFSYQGDRWKWTPMFTHLSTIMERVSVVYPEMHTDASYFFYLDREGLRSREVGSLGVNIRSLAADVRTNLANSTFVTRLDDVLARYNEQVTLARVPLFLLIFLGIATLMYYIFLVAVMLVRARSTEIATLKSRGATTLQVTLLTLVEGAMLAVPAIVLGPILAVVVVATLGHLLAASSPELGLVTVAFSPRAFALGAGGGFLALLTLVVATLVTARHGIVEFRYASARPPRAPFVHRYYLDILALALIGLVWWQVQQQRSFLVRPLGQQGLQIDYTLLLGPVLGVLALALVFMRVFPIVANILSRTAEPATQVWLVQGLRRVARDPIMPGAVLLLLVLGTAMGVVGSTFSASLARSQDDQALYAAGTDLRLDSSDWPPASYAINDLYSSGKLPGVESWTPVLRNRATLSTENFGRDFTLMAVNPDAFSKIAWNRPDFYPVPLPQQMTLIKHSKPLNDGILIPEEADTLGLWVFPARPDPRTFLRARFRDSSNQHFDIILGRLDFKEWRNLQAAIVAAPPPGRRGGTLIFPKPYTLVSLYVASTFTRTPGVLFLDDLTISSLKGPLMTLDGAQLGQWHAFDDPAFPGMGLVEVSDAVQRNDGPSTRFSWSASGFSTRGIRPGLPDVPVPILMSENLLKSTNLKLGDVVTARISDVAVPVKILSTVSFVPTLYPGDEGFALADLNGLLTYVNARTARLFTDPTEMWLKASSPEDLKPAAIINQLNSRGGRVRQLAFAPELITSRQSHPLLTAGWTGLLALTFITVVVASASTIMLYSYLDTRERQTELALLRTMGFTRGQLNGVVWFGLGLVMLLGVAVGTWAGQALASALLPLLEVAEEGRRVVPPMVLQVNWLTLFWYYLLLGAVGILTALGLMWLLAKRRIHQVLRIGEA